LKKRSLKSDNSGQVIIVSALLIALLLLSTALYVIETEKDTPAIQAQDSNFPAYMQSARNTLISALANVTSGGATGVLTADLNELKSTITSHSYQAMLQMEITPFSTAPYQNGLWISWGANGVGVSSACVSFAFASSGSSATNELESVVNVASEVHLSGSYLLLEGSSKQVNLTVNVLNEGKPALAGDFTVYFELDGSLSPEDWVLAGSPSTINFGNGTYAVSFNAETSSPSDSVLASVHCRDQRGILVVANATCTKMG
jgi:hypothetical protein